MKHSYRSAVSFGAHCAAVPCTIVEKMSLKAKIEAVIYAAEEPVTLAQFAGIFAQELPPPEPEPETQQGVESQIDGGYLHAENFLAGNTNQLAEMALPIDQEKCEQPDTTADLAAAEADAKRAARQRERQVREQIKAIVDDLIEEYSTSDRGMEIREVAGGYRIATKPEYHDAVRSFVKSLKSPMKLSLQALETLAVIAYKQPVTAPEVAEIRGVQLERRAWQPGQPQAYHYRRTQAGHRPANPLQNYTRIPASLRPQGPERVTQHRGVREARRRHRNRRG